MKIKQFFVMTGLCMVLTECMVSNTPNDEAKDYPWFSFSWYSAKLSGKKFDKVAMLIPAKVNDLNANFTLQFDLGSDATLIYGNTIASYYKESEIKNFLVENSKSTDNGGKTIYSTKDIVYHLGKTSVNTSKYLDRYGDKIVADSLFTKNPKHIGSLGADVFANNLSSIANLG